MEREAHPSQLCVTVTVTKDSQLTKEKVSFGSQSWRCQSVTSDPCSCVHRKQSIMVRHLPQDLWGMPASKLAIASHFTSQCSIGTKEETGHQCERTNRRPQAEVARKLPERTGMVCRMIKGTGGDIM